MANRLFGSYRLDQDTAKDIVKQLIKRITEFEKQSQNEAKKYLTQLKQSQVLREGEDSSEATTNANRRPKFKKIQVYNPSQQRKKKKAGFFRRLFSNTLCCAENREDFESEALRNNKRFSRN